LKPIAAPATATWSLNFARSAARRLCCTSSGGSGRAMRILGPSLGSRRSGQSWLTSVPACSCFSTAAGMRSSAIRLASSFYSTMFIIKIKSRREARKSWLFPLFSPNS
jgi:hypothetical protein